ncbi:MAG: branched-chain amino acid ABC transporter permease [Betaproteobacteria bacterium]|nr:MAG: branched-chain amino acid ABC transporter permease [Betaproteobacteria bacterium]
MRGLRAGTVVLLACLLALALLPLVAEKYYIQLFTKMMIMAIFAMSLDLLVGFTGLVSLGHAAFFGLAGYVLAFAAPQYQAADLWLSLPLAMVCSGLLALIIGALVLRTSGIYFIMVTLAFAQMVFFLFHDTKIAGGADGIYVYAKPVAAIAGWEPFTLENHTHFYFVVLVLLALVYACLRLLLNSLFGRVIVGIRVNEPRMKSLGYRTFRYKLVCFVLAGALAGMAGYFAAAQFGFVSPETLGWHQSGSVLMMVILGGMGTLTGAVLGAFAMMLVELGLQGLPVIGGVEIAKHWQLLMGAFIVCAVLLLPQGLLGLGKLASRLRSKPAEARDG